MISPFREVEQIVIFEEISAERRRQEGFVATGKFDWTCADPAVFDDVKLAVLMEEVGEVAREICEQTRDPAWRIKLRVELVQVAAVAVAWLEAIGDPS